MNNNILIWRWRQRRTPCALLKREYKTPQLLNGMKFTILVERYNDVTPFGQEGQEVLSTLPPEPQFDHLGIIPNNLRHIYLDIFSIFVSKQNLTATRKLFSYDFHVQISTHHS